MEDVVLTFQVVTRGLSADDACDLEERISSEALSHPDVMSVRFMGPRVVSSAPVILSRSAGCYLAETYRQDIVQFEEAGETDEANALKVELESLLVELDGAVPVAEEA